MFIFGDYYGIGILRFSKHSQAIKDACEKLNGVNIKDMRLINLKFSFKSMIYMVIISVLAQGCYMFLGGDTEDVTDLLTPKEAVCY